MRLEWTKNDKLVVFWPILTKKSHFGYAIDLQKILMCTTNLSDQDAWFQYLYNYIESDDFFYQIVAKVVETQKFSDKRLNHICIIVHILILLLE